MRYVAVALVVLWSMAVLAEQGAEPRFEVISIKPHTGPPTISVPPPSPGALRRPNVTVQALVLYAFQVDDYQLIDMPPWGRADRFDVEAKAEGATTADMRAMTRSLLRDRFGLQAHKERRDGTTYSLVLANANGKLGPNMKPSNDDCKSNVSAPANVPPGAVRGGGCSDADFIATTASRALGAPVVNRTGLAGLFEYSMFYSPDGDPLFGRGTTATAPDTAAPHFSTALQEQLGLKVEKSRGQVDVLVIDHIERPTAN